MVKREKEAQNVWLVRKTKTKKSINYKFREGDNKLRDINDFSIYALDKKRIEFILCCGKEKIDLGNIMAASNHDHILITGVNTCPGFENKGITHLTIGWIISNILHHNKESCFKIKMKYGVEPRQILKKTGVDIYNKIFPKNNKNVEEINSFELIKTRYFPASSRKEDEDYFYKLWKEKATELVKGNNKDF